jgi:hypothetical protein
MKTTGANRSDDGLQVLATATLDDALDALAGALRSRRNDDEFVLALTATIAGVSAPPGA